MKLSVDGYLTATTEDHPFWNASDRAWERANELRDGDLVTGVGGVRLRVVAIDLTQSK